MSFPFIREWYLYEPFTVTYIYMYVVDNSKINKYYTKLNSVCLQFIWTAFSVRYELISYLYFGIMSVPKC